MLESEETELIVRISTSNQVVKEVVQRAGRFTVVEERLQESSGKKIALAKAFCDLHGPEIKEGKFDKIFIESGSTLTYLAAELAQYLPKAGRLQMPQGQETILVAEPKPIVATNNALAYLDLWLCNGVISRPEPDSPPSEDERYGAMYGTLRGKKRDPDYALPDLAKDDPRSWDAVRDLTQHVFLNGVKEPSHSIVLAAASGLQLSPNILPIHPRTNPRDLNQPDIPYTYRPTLKQVRKCRGFHVGSYENKLLKRSLYLTRMPTIVLLHEEKIDCPIEVGKCHFLFDRGYSWSHVSACYPLSIWVACTLLRSQERLAQLKKYMPKGWRFRMYGDGNYPIIIGHNASFREACNQVRISYLDALDT